MQSSNSNSAAATPPPRSHSAPTESNVNIGEKSTLSESDVRKINALYNCSTRPPSISADGIARAIETGLSLGTAAAAARIDVMAADDELLTAPSPRQFSPPLHSLRPARPRTFFWFRNAADFRRRTGVAAPAWLRFAYNDDAPDYPREG